MILLQLLLKLGMQIRRRKREREIRRKQNVDQKSMRTFALRFVIWVTVAGLTITSPLKFKHGSTDRQR